MTSKLKSRKLWVTVITAFLVILLDVDEATIENLVSLAMAYVFGQGAADAAKEIAKKKPAPAKPTPVQPILPPPTTPHIPFPSPTPKPSRLTDTQSWD
jgi:hypothetical protein